MNISEADIRRSSQILVKHLEQAMGNLFQIWDRIGIGESQIGERSNTVMQHLTSLLDDMVEEEETLEKRILQRVRDLTTELQVLSKELQLPPHKVTAKQSMLIEKELRLTVEDMKVEKTERVAILRLLHGEDQKLCDCLCMTPYYVPSGTTPSGEQLDKLKQHISELAAEKEKRFRTFRQQKQAIADLMVEMERAIETSFEKEVMEEDEYSFLLSSENMRSLDALLAELIAAKAHLEKKVSDMWDRLHLLWDRMDTPTDERDTFTDGKMGFKPAVIDSLREEISRYEALKLQNIQRFVVGLRDELKQWWDRCYYSDDQRNEFVPFYDDDFREELLERHEVEVRRVKEYYDHHKHILERVAKREDLFKEMIEMEKKASDPNRFFHDRGGRLLLEEKARKKLQASLPKVEAAVTDDIHRWETEHGRTFLVHGVSYMDHINASWAEFEESKSKEKAERQKAKARLMDEEVLYGSKPSTPVKRRFQPSNTPTKTPKYRKMNESKTPSSCSSRIGQTMMYHSPYKRLPMSTSKVPQASKIMSSTNKMAPGSRQRRRSKRIARNVLGEYNAGTNNETVFSHTTVSSSSGGGQSVAGIGGNISVASMGSYQDFATGLNPTARPFCRSSLAPPPPSPSRLLSHNRLL